MIRVLCPSPSVLIPIFFQSGVISICVVYLYITPVETGTNRYKLYRPRGTKNQEPRLQGGLTQKAWFLVLGSTGPAQNRHNGTSCAGPREPRTKNQDCREVLPRNLGSWFLVPRGRHNLCCCAGFVPAYVCSTTLVWEYDPILQGGPGTKMVHCRCCLQFSDSKSLAASSLGHNNPLPRPKSQDCRARPPCNLGSWLLVPCGRRCAGFVPAYVFRQFRGC